MMSPTPKGKEKEKESETPEIELTEAQRLKRSFERSLAGPSVGKAGLIRDQTGKSGFWRGCWDSEINRIIAEASKVSEMREWTWCQGSKFYNNQVRKDAELNDKITWFQQKVNPRSEYAADYRETSYSRLPIYSDSKLRLIDWYVIYQSHCWRQLLEVEATRDLTQTIVHVDMDAFVSMTSCPSLMIVRRCRSKTGPKSKRENIRGRRWSSHDCILWGQEIWLSIGDGRIRSEEAMSTVDSVSIGTRSELTPVYLIISIYTYPLPRTCGQYWQNTTRI
jgi:hypothetical protein